MAKDTKKYPKVINSYSTKIKNKEEVVEQIYLKQYKTKKEIDEAWFRYFIYGDIEEKETCDIYQRVKDKNTYKDRFPTIFVYALIEHLISCKNCSDLYFKDNCSQPKEKKGIEK